MKFYTDGRFFRYLLGWLLCAPALVMPYRIRLAYNSFLSFLFHTPYVLFGFLARFLLDRLKIYPAEKQDGR